MTYITLPFGASRLRCSHTYGAIIPNVTKDLISGRVWIESRRSTMRNRRQPEGLSSVCSFILGVGIYTHVCIMPVANFAVEFMSEITTANRPGGSKWKYK